MNVFLTGATGAIGAPTVRGLVECGHTVRAVARTGEKAARLQALGAKPVEVDLFDADAVKRAVDGSEAVMHLATNVPPLRQMTKKRAWDTHNRLRTTATELLVEAAVATGASTFVKESVTFVYPDLGDQWIDETVPPAGDVAMLEPTLEGERIAARFGESGGRAVVLRFGFFYGPTTRYVDEMLRLARWRMSMVGGKPGAYLSSIHTDDVASAAITALEAPSGTYNVVDDEPLTRREYLDACSNAFGLKRLRVMPTWMTRLGSGSAHKAVTRSWRIRNRKLVEATGWRPLHPNAREGWAAVARAREASRA
jgi:nucleoside-diphosphate-sugar epimerase